MDIGGMGSAYADYMTKQVSGNKASALQSKLENSNATVNEDELKSACKEFESYFVEQMFNAMNQRQTKGVLRMIDVEWLF